MRDISKVLLFRNDISPFLVHLTRHTERKAKRNLLNILTTMTLKYGSVPFGDAKYRYPMYKLATDGFYFSAVSFTETPLNEVHTLLEIGGRAYDLQPYGIAFLKERLMKRGASPVFYVNNLKGDKDHIVEALCDLIDKNRILAAKILPYIAVFGKKLTPFVGAAPGGMIDFRWEREWRYTSRSRYLKFSKRDVFIGLCPHNERDYFKRRIPWLDFIDPRRSMKWYSEELVAARQRSHLKYSLV